MAKAKQQPEPTYTLTVTRNDLANLSMLLEIASKNAFMVPLEGSAFVVPHRVSDWLKHIEKALADG